MTPAQAARSGPGADTDDASTTAGADDVGAFLATVAALLRETITRFESTVGRITETVVTRSVQVDRDLIVTLQDFDRLQQEFAALGDVIAHCAATARGGSPGDASWRDTSHVPRTIPGPNGTAAGRSPPSRSPTCEIAF